MEVSSAVYDGLAVVLLVAAAIFSVYHLLGWLMPQSKETHPFFDWAKFTEKIDADEKWHSCHEGPGCDWPEYCKPGNCRRPD